MEGSRIEERFPHCCRCWEHSRNQSLDRTMIHRLWRLLIRLLPASLSLDVMILCASERIHGVVVAFGCTDRAKQTADSFRGLHIFRAEPGSLAYVVLPESSLFYEWYWWQPCRLACMHTQISSLPCFSATLQDEWLHNCDRSHTRPCRRTSKSLPRYCAQWRPRQELKEALALVPLR